MLEIKSKNSEGLYFPVFDWMAVQINGQTPYSIKEVVHHEVSHHIWYRCMSEKERDGYFYYYNISHCKLNFEGTSYPESKWLTEDFAYSYEAFMMETYLCKEKIHYFHNLSQKTLNCTR